MPKQTMLEGYWVRSLGRSWVAPGMCITNFWNTTSVTNIINNHMFIKLLKKENLGKVCPDIYNFFKGSWFFPYDFHLLRLLIVESCSKGKEQSYHSSLNAKHGSIWDLSWLLVAWYRFYFIAEVYSKSSPKT